MHEALRLARRGTPRPFDASEDERRVSAQRFFGTKCGCGGDIGPDWAGLAVCYGCYPDRRPPERYSKCADEAAVGAADPTGEFNARLAEWAAKVPK
jgi:hypothetical protein